MRQLLVRVTPDLAHETDDEWLLLLDAVNAIVDYEGSSAGDPWDADDEEATEWDPMLDYELDGEDDDEDGEDEAD